MARTAEQVGQRAADGFRHEALLYAGEDGFVEATVPWIRDAVAEEEPILVVVGAAKIARLRSELGADAERVAFADMAEVGVNPARIIPAWREFVDASRRGAPAAGHRRADLAASERRGACRVPAPRGLLNLAFAGAETSGCCARTTSTPSRPSHREGASQPPHRGRGRRPRGARAYGGLETVAGAFAEQLPVAGRRRRACLRRGHARRAAPARERARATPAWLGARR